MTSFELPLPSTAADDAWGPGAPPQLAGGVPFAPFKKSERVGHAADWNKAAQRGRGHQSASTTDDDFATVDYSTVRFKPKQYGRRNMLRQARRVPAQLDLPKTRQYAKALASGQSRKRGGFKSWTARKGGAPQRRPPWEAAKAETRRASVAVRGTWRLVEQLAAGELGKARAGVPKRAAQRAAFGRVRKFDARAERVTAERAAALEHARHARRQCRLTTTDDPVLQRLAMAGGDGGASVFATDRVLVHLMTATRAFNSFDVVVQKIAGKIFLDKRDGSPLDYPSVDENADEPPAPDAGANAPEPLAREARRVNETLAQQVLDANADAITLGDAPPYFDDDDDDDDDELDEEEAAERALPPADRGYVYREFTLEDGTGVLVRCEVDAYVGDKNSPTYATVRALNEYAPGTPGDWKHKLDKQRGAVLIKEMKQNNAKLSRWTAEALLAGNEQLKIGYVSRVKSRTSEHHHVLGLQTFITRDFAKQLSLPEAMLWGVFGKILSVLQPLDNGKYVIFKDPETRNVRIYEVPANTFEDDDSDDDDAGADDGGDDDDGSN